MRKSPPGPPPANGLIAQLKMIAKFSRGIMPTLAEWYEQYGETFCIESSKYRQLVFTNPDHIYEIAVTHAAKFHKDEDYNDPQKGLARVLGNGLVTSDGEFWKRQRKLAAPAFHAKRITAYADTMVEATSTMLTRWPEYGKLSVSREMTRLTMLIVARTLFNIDVSDEVERVGKAMHVIQEWGGKPRILRDWIPTPLELRLRRAKRDLDEIIYRIIRERRATGEDKGDLLSMLLLARDDDGNTMTDEQARDEAVTLFLAGHETTANALNWTFYLLAQHPEVEAKLHQEVDTVLNGRTPTLGDLEHLPYTEMVVKESMRLYPPVWAFSREAIEDVEIGGYQVDKSNIVGVLTYFTHRDPRWFNDPERFEPERFSAENEPNIPKYAYVPFGGGPRICIGNAFAMMEARLILATVASRYRLTLEPGQKVDMNPMITLNPKGGLSMIAQRRNRMPLAKTQSTMEQVAV